MKNDTVCTLPEPCHRQDCPHCYPENFMDEPEPRPIPAALKVYADAVNHAELTYRQTVAEANRVRQQAINDALATCQAVLDAQAPANLKITVGERRRKDSGEVEAFGRGQFINVTE